MPNSGKMNLDLSNSNVVSRYLWNKGFFPKDMKVYPYDKYSVEQNKGIDIEAKLPYDSRPFRIDLKYATDYIDRYLNTFCLELAHLSKKDYTTPVEGWYRSEKIDTEKYLFGWPKGKYIGSARSSLDTSQYVVLKDSCYIIDNIELVYVSRKELNDFLRNEIIGENLYDMLINASYEDLVGLFDINTYRTTCFYKQYVKYVGTDRFGNISKYKLKLHNWKHGNVSLSYSKFLKEAPVNLLVEKEVYKSVPGARYWNMH